MRRTPQGSVRAGPSCRRRGSPTWTPSSTRRRLSRPDGSRLPQHRQARRAQRAHGLHPGRDAAPAARVPRRRVVNASAPARRHALRAGVGRARHGARSRGAGAVGARPRHRARRDRARRQARGRADADLFGLPGHRGHRARRARGASTKAGLGPGATSRLQRAPAWTTDWISAEGRRKLREYGIAPPGPVRAGWRRARSASSAARRDAVACPRCGSTQHRAPVRVRFHGLQGDVPLHRVPRTFRTLQADLKRPIMSVMFHPLRVRAVGPTPTKR